MATYKEIKGVTVQTLDEDPVTAGATWASGGNMNAGRAGIAGAGIQTANVGFGGITSNPPAAGTANTESYNGTSWTEVNNLNNDREITNGVGLYTAALCIGNDPPYSAAVESWDGTNWTNGTNLPAPRAYGAAFGTQTAAIYTGGYTDGDSPVSGSTLYWNGSAWTELNDLNTTRLGLSSSTNGTYTAAVVFGGGSNKNTESWNGSAWTEVNDLITAAPNAAGGGNQTSAFVAKGGVSVTTQTWDGTNWASAADAATATTYSNKGGGGATNAAGIVYTGSTNPGLSSYTTSTEEFTEPPTTQAKLVEGMLFLSGGTGLKGFGRAAGIPAGTWSSGGSMNTGRQDQASFGLTQNDSLAVSGNSPSTVNVENYNGTSWTEVNNVTTGREFFSGGGTTAAGMVYSGTAPSGPANTANVEDWNGSSWTEIADVNTARYGAGGTKTGTPVSQAMFCGNDGSNRGYTETWNGTSWTEVADANTSRRLCAGVGSGNSDALVFGGDTNPSPYTVNTETWDGTSWTEVNNLNTARRLMGSAGNTTAALCIGGDDPSADTAKNEFWNGTSWTELADLASAKSNNSGSGSAALGLSIGGPPSLTTTEEWTADATLSTVTVS